MKKIEIELFISGELKDEPIICNMIKNFNITMKIVEASFSTESGWAYLIISGQEADLDKTLDFLEKKGIKVEIKDSE